MAIMLFPISHILQSVLEKSIKNQNFIEVELTDRSKKDTYQLIAFQLLFAMVIFAFSWFMGGIFFDLFAGGYLLSMLIGLMLLLQNIFYFKGLRNPQAATGKIRFSTEYGYKNLSNRLLAAGLLCIALFILFGNYYYLGACLFIFASSQGYLRKSKQVTDSGSS
ncbi:MAG: hypothetical protein KZQ58_06755 [gamma proteobacterium symbiont of Bathyaustriella thionipta]|nr:hypothetical protein [gamma proteobacterium symbiont of Bathyaustriella thionipta]